MSKSIVVFGGSSSDGQKVTGDLVKAGHSVINVDHNKSEVEGVTRYPFDLGSAQTKGILAVANPDIIINCEVVGSDRVSELQYLSRVCEILMYAEEHNVANVMFLSHGGFVDRCIAELQAGTSVTVVHICDDFDRLSEALA